MHKQHNIQRRSPKVVNIPHSYLGFTRADHNANSHTYACIHTCACLHTNAFLHTRMNVLMHVYIHLGNFSRIGVVVI